MEQPRLPHIAARYDTADDFFGVYTPDLARTYVVRGDTLLHAALGNKSAPDRTAMVNRLLDDGADASLISSSGWSCAHLLLARIGIGEPRDDLNVPLLRRLFDAGCDVNYMNQRDGTVLLSLAAEFGWSDEELSPYYDEIFARSELDLLAITSNNRTDLDTIRRWSGREGLALRIEQHLTDQGIEVPTGTVFELATWAKTEAILAGYRSEDAVKVDPSSGKTLLHIVLDHADLDTRIDVANRLLDDGADTSAKTPDGLTAAHILLRGHSERDASREAILLQRILETGDVNAVAKGNVGTPLNCLSKMTNQTEETRFPLYDVLLNHPEFNPFTEVGRTKTAMDLLSKTRTEILRERIAAKFG